MGRLVGRLQGKHALEHHNRGVKLPAASGDASSLDESGDKVTPECRATIGSP